MFGLGWHAEPANRRSASSQIYQRHARTPSLFALSKEGKKNPATAAELGKWEALRFLKNMKTQQRKNGFRETARRLFRRRVRRHDPMLVLNMSTFNFTDSWSRIFASNEYGRFYA